MHRIKSKENKEAISEKENSYIDQINLNAPKKKSHSHYNRVVFLQLGPGTKQT